ncbi:MAG: ATP-dependent zinc metalloprotease FtsH [Candidatus Dormibacteria bacterium]
MSPQRRRPALLGALAALAAGVVVATLLSAHSGPPHRDRGALSRAVHNAQTHTGSPRDRIATDSSHQAVVKSDSVTWYDATGRRYRTDVTSSFEVTQLFDGSHFENWKEDSGGSSVLLRDLLPMLIFGVVAFFLIRMVRGGSLMGGLGKSRARSHAAAETTGVTFADVAGADEAVLELSEIVTVLRDPGRYERIGARVPRGVLLVGPPGTGKTLLARAVAGEANVPFFSISGSEFVEMFVGVGAARVRDLFREARKVGPAIVFIDEIDAVGRSRGSGSHQSNDEREQTLNQLLVEMDGFDGGAPVIVIAATNRPDVLDPALLRPGRFDRRVIVDTPDITGRVAILGVHARGKPFAEGVDLRVIARQTPGLSGAELANVVNEAALLTARRERVTISMAELEEACLRVQAGPERANSLLSEAEKEIVAYHEMGHALVGVTLQHSDPVHRISIVSRGRALGWTMQLPERDRVLMSRAQLTDQLAGLLGGRMAEELVFGDDLITTGAADDIERASKMAHRMVTEMGMSPLGPRAFFAADPGSPRAYSEDVAAAVDAEVDRLLAEAERRARQVLNDRRAALNALAARLVEVETMDAAEMREVLERFPAPTVPLVTIHPRHDQGWGRPAVNRPPAQQPQPRSEPMRLPERNRSGGTPLVPLRPGVVRRTTAAFVRFAFGARARG